MAISSLRRTDFQVAFFSSAPFEVLFYWSRKITNLWWFLAGMASVVLPLVFFVLLLVVDAKRRKSVCMKSYQSGLSKDKFLVAKRQNSRNLAATLKEIRP